MEPPSGTPAYTCSRLTTPLTTVFPWKLDKTALAAWQRGRTGYPACAGSGTSAGITLGKTYPQPLVDHAKGRERALAAYAKIRKG